LIQKAISILALVTATFIISKEEAPCRPMMVNLTVPEIL